MPKIAVARAGRDDQVLDLGRLASVSELDARLAALDPLDQRARVDAHPLLLEPALRRLAGDNRLW